jgi:hypothetical protein
MDLKFSHVDVLVNNLETDTGQQSPFMNRSF